MAFEEWDDRACKLILLDSELALAIRDFPWGKQSSYAECRFMDQLTGRYCADQKVLCYLGCPYDAYSMAFLARSMRIIARDIRDKVQQEKDRDDKNRQR